jgi:hypothetical protein
MTIVPTQYKFEAVVEGDDYRSKSKVTVETEAEDLNELCEAFMSFLQGAGFGYVKQVCAYSEFENADTVIGDSEYTYNDDQLEMFLKNEFSKDAEVFPFPKKDDPA